MKVASLPRTLFALAGTITLFSGAAAVAQPLGIGLEGVFGPRYQPRTDAIHSTLRHHPQGLGDALSRLQYWNDVALDANAHDHTPIPEGESGVSGEQVGPCRTARS